MLDAPWDYCETVKSSAVIITYPVGVNRTFVTIQMDEWKIDTVSWYKNDYLPKSNYLINSFGNVLNKLNEYRSRNSGSNKNNNNCAGCMT